MRNTTVTSIIGFIASAYLGFQLAWEWQKRKTSVRIELYKKLYINYVEQHKWRKRETLSLAEAYEQGFQDAYLVEELDDDREMAMEEGKELLQQVLEEWKDDPDLTLHIYPFANRNFG